MSNTSTSGLLARNNFRLRRDSGVIRIASDKPTSRDLSATMPNWIISESTTIQVLSPLN
jgi:hypothetical protein